jgi:hypothetical protein
MLIINLINVSKSKSKYKKTGHKSLKMTKAINIQTSYIENKKLGKNKL